jgi:hypothetical protein
MKYKLQNSNLKVATNVYATPASLNNKGDIRYYGYSTVQENFRI